MPKLHCPNLTTRLALTLETASVGFQTAFKSRGEIDIGQGESVEHQPTNLKVLGSSTTVVKNVSSFSLAMCSC